MIQHKSFYLPSVRNFFKTIFWLCIYTTLYTYVKAEDSSADCKVTNATSQLTYDLSGLKRTEDWKIESKDFNYKFRMSVCRALNDPGNVKQKENAGVWGSKTSEENLGNYNMTPYLIDDMLFLKYEGGENNYCKTTDSTYFYTSLIRFICDQTVDKSNPPKLINVFNDCAFWFEWRTPIACPVKMNSQSTSPIGVFFTILGIALAVYFIGGVVYNRIVYNASGVRQIPHWEFWRDTLDFTKDMILIILAQCPIPIFQPRRRPGNYRNLPRDEEHILIDEEFEEH
ncbi:21416_t:CDS:2 [Dentiscutata erythropus]|uniref:21416_t:CDS:1 n=1 Tax=Dentiscutata erythropus TaxID=1348616 RepID=A0A9N8VCH6_9GLOM|nr:21416_t:CDS:2 [Dentiscutata erythropus]